MRRTSDTPPPPARARVVDIARDAKVSTATVDRVLNKRPGVRALTVGRVLEAARRLGYLPDGEDLPAAGTKPMRLLFLLPAGNNRFIRMLGDTVEYSEAHWAPFNVRCKTEFFEGFNPEVLAQALLRNADRADGIAFMAQEHPLVRDAVNTLAARGVHTITLISDISGSHRSAYVGLDNRAAGRTAAYLMARFIGERHARVAMIAGSVSYRAHEEREMGFLYLFREQFPRIEVVGLREGRDDAQKNYELTVKLMEQYPDLAGIYNIGGGPEGVARALKECGRDQKIVFIGHGLTPETRALLINGTMDAVMTQNPQRSLMACVRIFTNLRDRQDIMSGVEPVKADVIFRENLP